MMRQPKMPAQGEKIVQLLQSAGRPLSAYDILDRLRRSGVRSPPTVYRALERLEAMGLVHRVASLGAFVSCQCHHASSDHGDHHAQTSPFAICTACGDVQEIHDPNLTRLLKKMGAAFLAQVDKRVFELSGVCHACRAKDKGAKHV